MNDPGVFPSHLIFFQTFIDHNPMMSQNETSTENQHPRSLLYPSFHSVSFRTDPCTFHCMVSALKFHFLKQISHINTATKILWKANLCPPLKKVDKSTTGIKQNFQAFCLQPVASILSSLLPIENKTATWLWTVFCVFLPLLSCSVFSLKLCSFIFAHLHAHREPFFKPEIRFALFS